MNNIYIVECESGSWDNHITFIIGVYSDSTRAEEAKRLFLAKLLEYKTRYTPEQQAKFEEIDEDDLEYISKDVRDYWNWKHGSCLNYGQLPSEKVEIKEMPLNEMIYKF